MSNKSKYHLALTVLVVACVALIGMAVTLNNPAWIVPVPISLFAFGLWGNTLRCTNCGTPYLFEIKGGVTIPKTFPEHCRKCGHVVK